MFKKAIGESIGKGLDIVDKLVPDKDKKQEFAAMLIQAELDSDSHYVKNARPTIIYFGIFLGLIEALGLRVYLLDLLTTGEDALKYSNSAVEYLLFTWGGVVGVYIGGRSYEKRKMKNLTKNK
tara:strand:- start:745 stop:1113 length:369 start_codon:yes stop_codon:yes gene_type:complete